MRIRRCITLLLAAALPLYAVSFFAWQEGNAHDQSGFCVIDLSMPPPFIGFEHWSQVGIALAVLATGISAAAFLIWRNDSM